MELENSRLVKELDQREIQWEQREAELECAIEKNTISNVCGQTMFLCSVLLAFLTLRNILILIMWLQLTNDPLNNKNIHFVSELDLFDFIKKIRLKVDFYIHRNLPNNLFKMHKLNRRTPVLRSIFSVLLRTGYWMEARFQKYTPDCRNKAIIGRESQIRRLQERLAPAARQLLKWHLRTPVTEVGMSVDLFTAVDATGIYTVSRNTINCSCSFYIENGMPCHHILAYCTRSNTEVNTQSICDRIQLPTIKATSFSNDGGKIVSINSEEFTERDINTEEHAYYNRLCDICHPAQPPHETADEAAWYINTENMNEFKSIPNLLADEDIETVCNQADHKDNFNEISKSIPLNSEQPSSTCVEESVQDYNHQTMNKLKNENTTLRKRLTQLLQLLHLQDIKLQNAINHCSTTQNPDIQSALAGLRANMELLQRRLNGKDESLARVNELLKQAYEANEKSNDRHNQEIAILQNKLQNKMEEQLLQLAQNVESVGRNEISNVHLMELKKRLYELEESLNEQNQAVFRQAEQTKVIRQECDLWQLKYNQLQTKTETMKANIENLHREETMKLTSQIEQLQKELDKSNVKLNEYNHEVKRWKAEANKSPSVMQRQLAERLRTDLLEKDKQIRALSKALGELRHDLVTQAEQAVLATNSMQPIQCAPPFQEVNESITIDETVVSPVSANPIESAILPQSAKTNHEVKISNGD
ncbi:unnamed protein product [Schistosoma mattheei]|uniref:SWIM-type domain-containing protein n=1 Tax=Schistosoma mattheei TaxID=31246 RepID=A0A3P8FS63_9TREM|nr:unnamed protein product [Schistosoma mattheei]